MPDSKILEAFHPLLRDWFLDRFSTPTEIQVASWPRIRAGNHLLITAPTGSGKTLTAFYSAIDAMVREDKPTGQTNVLYVSPLKALNTDIRRNLEEPLSGLKQRFEDARMSWPDIRVAVRSGDTPQSDRQRMLRHRPEIVITTPESLALLLTTERGRQMLSTVSCVIMDEIHAVLDSRRGVHLMVSLERLVELTGEFQRIALSATVKPLDQVAKYVGGTSTTGKPRPVEVIRSEMKTNIDLQVRFPPAVRELAMAGESIWPALIDEFKRHLGCNRSTLIFSASRRQSERITHLINEDADEILAYAHHGSLSREIRSEVESRLKAGSLRSIVATSSLELGIDIGELDEVLLVQSPDSVASAMQRIGRAGHQVGEVSRATFYPMFARDFLDAAVIAGAIQSADIEPVSILEEPLDLLAQTIVSMVATEDWHLDDIFDVITRASAYRSLSRRVFDLVVEMLCGKYERSRIRDLKPRLILDEETQVLTIRKGAVMALYTNGGTIPDRGYFKLRHADSNALIGELDEEFVWETQVGKQFAFGSQQWTVTDINHNDVLVRASSAKDSIPPFYRSEFINKSFYFSQQVGRFLEFADSTLGGDKAYLLIAELQKRGFDLESAEELVRYLSEQRAATGCDLPHINHVVAEHITSGPGGYQSAGSVDQLVLHTSWGGAVNRPIALSLAAVWEERFDTVPDISVDNHMIAIQLKQDVSVDEIISMLAPDDLVPKIRNSLEKSGFFGARFRECAGRALLLSKNRFDRRMPFWQIRMQAKDLMNSVLGYSDFPILLETWRSCLKDEFDIESTRKVLDELSTGEIRLSHCELTRASPFASAITHEQLNRYVYDDDSPEGGRISSLSDELIAHALRDAALRPPIDSPVIEQVERKLKRLEHGYAPESEVEFVEWIKERVWLPIDELACEAHHFHHIEVIEQGDQSWYFHRANTELVQGDLAIAVANAVQFHGPKTRSEWLQEFPLGESAVSEILDDLLGSGVLIGDVVIIGIDELTICDSRNLSMLLRFQRQFNKPAVQTRRVKQLPAFLAAWNQLGGENSETLILGAIERLQGFVAPVRVWLNDLWTARTGAADLGQIAALCTRYGVNWRGHGKEKISLGIGGEFFEPAELNERERDFLDVFKDPQGSYSFEQLQANWEGTSAEFNEVFWEAAWHGRITSDSLMTLSQAQQAGYAIRTLVRSESRRAMGRLSLQNPNSAQNARGLWRRVFPPSLLHSEIDELESAKESARVLLARYGFLCREFCQREGSSFRWLHLFKALRMMELSGEVTSGLFFEELGGPQFISPSALQKFIADETYTSSFWVSSLDPVAPCGLGLKWTELPTRSVANNLGFGGGELLIVSRSYGKHLSIFTDASDPRLEPLLRSMHQAIAQRKSMTIESINGESALTSEYQKLLDRFLPIRRSNRDLYVDAIVH